MPKPSFINWTVGNVDFATITVEPSNAKKQQGWMPDEMPPMEYFNWLFYQCDQLSQWLDRAKGADIIVGDETIDDYDNLSDAIAAATEGQTIRVKKDLTLNSTVVINVDNLRLVIDPQYSIIKGTALTGLQIDANGVRLIEGRMQGFSTSGDKAIEVLTGSLYCMIRDYRFKDCDTDVSDVDGTSSITGSIIES